MIVAVNNRDIKTATRLLQIGADKNIANNENQTAFDIAFENNDDALIDLLTEFDT